MIQSGNGSAKEPSGTTGKSVAHRPLISINGLRRIVQLSLLGVLLVLPLMNLLRLDTMSLGGSFDISSLKLHLFGAEIWLNNFFVINLSFLWLIALFTFFSVVLGRVFCGWICPQTLFSELVVNGSKGKLIGKALFSLLLSLYVSFNTLLYFVDLSYLEIGLLNPKSFPVIFWSFWIITLIFFVDLFVYRHVFCNGFCPYGWLQSIFQNENAIVVRYDKSRNKECLKCKKCVTCCYMDIDIRQGPLQMECQKCGKCIDACRDAVRDEGIKKFISFSVENPKGEPGRILSFRSASLCVVLAVLTGLIAFFIVNSGSFKLVVNRNSSYMPISKSKDHINSYRLEIDSIDGEEHSLVLGVSGIKGVKILKKNNIVSVKGGKKKIVRVFVSAPKENLKDGVNSIKFTITDIKNPKLQDSKANSFVYHEHNKD